MALKLPPQHRVDARPVFIHEDDEAWDKDRIKSECEAMEAVEKGSSVMHPAIRYLSGSTRYDLHARLTLDGKTSSAADYVDLPNAWQFHMRRLGSSDFAVVQSLLHRSERAEEGPFVAYEKAARLVFVKSEGTGAPASIDELHDANPGLVYEIGQAGYLCSMPLRDDEKKA